jgi:hypothetical protein
MLGHESTARGFLPLLRRLGTPVPYRNSVGFGAQRSRRRPAGLAERKHQPTAEIALRCSGTIKDGTRLRMKGASLMLHQRVSPGASVTVQIQFEAHSREVYGYRLLSGSWYPSAIPYRNGAYDTNQQGVDEYEAIATAPASLTLASAGELAESRSPSAGQQRRRWRLPHAANFTASTLRL